MNPTPSSAIGGMTNTEIAWSPGTIELGGRLFLDSGEFNAALTRDVRFANVRRSEWVALIARVNAELSHG